jgi:hypothetical protein
LRAYFEVRNLLAADLGADPSRETTDVYLDLLRGDVPTTETGIASARAEIQLLVQRLRQVVATVPGVEVRREDRALMKAAADLLAAS